MGLYRPQIGQDGHCRWISGEREKDSDNAVRLKHYSNRTPTVNIKVVLGVCDTRRLVPRRYLYPTRGYALYDARDGYAAVCVACISRSERT